MDDIPLESDEPFGMNGVLSWLRPALALCCALACVACIVMNARSAEYLDGIRRDSANSQLFIESVFGRLQFQFAGGNPRWTSQSDYVPYGRSIVGNQDAWDESWAKTLGLEWGDGVHYWQGGRQPLTPVWQVRMRWRTLALLFAVPPVVFIIMQSRRRIDANDADADLDPVADGTA